VKQGGFTLTKLRAEGSSAAPAEIRLFAGLNVITGLSNTGKSYIRQCFDYMTGSDATPKEIAEARSYEKLFLEIENNNQQFKTLERSLKGGDFLLYENSFDDKEKVTPEILKSKVDATKRNNISTFLLDLCGIDEVIKIRTNKQNGTENLTFRTISHFFIVDESKIIAETSPIFIANGYANTKMKSAFNFLLTGIDDSSLIAMPNKELQKAQIEAKREVYDQIIKDIEADLETKKTENENLGIDVNKIKLQIDEASKSIRESHNALLEYQQKREENWIQQQEAESRLIVIAELLKRFDLLKQHYISDLQRLEFINEGDHLFEQLEFVHCPFCGSAVEGHAFGKLCVNKEGELIKISEGCRQEAIKIKTLIKDLESTVTSLETEREVIQEMAQNSKREVAICDEQIKENLQPRKVSEKNFLDNLLIDRQRLAEIETNNTKLEELKTARTALEILNKDSTQKNTARGLDTYALRDLGDEIERLLEKWKFPNVGTVEFNEQKMDILVKGNPRQSNGKGIRALLHSAFTVGLMLFCKEKNLPHPGWVVLDSPLTTFKESNGQGELDEVSGEIQKAFFEHLSTLKDQQIIILENKVPSQELQSNMNFIEFVGKENVGRSGFFHM
jgi:hypothetical protein